MKQKLIVTEKKRLKIRQIVTSYSLIWNSIKFAQNTPKYRTRLHQLPFPISQFIKISTQLVQKMAVSM